MAAVTRGGGWFAGQTWSDRGTVAGLQIGSFDQAGGHD